MATFSKLKLSASTDGRAIKVAATATAGTLLHTGSATPGTIHEVWLYAVNSDVGVVKLTVEFGGVTSPDDLIEQYLEPEKGAVLIVPGFVVVGNATPLLVRAFAAVTNVVTVHGYVNQIA